MNQFNASKILRHLDRIAEWQQTGLSRPITYELDMTNVCNSRCSFCFGFFHQPVDTSSLSLSDAIDIIRQIKEFGGKGLTFTGGGDPLCNPATVEAVAYARGAGLDVGFITNGILLNESVARVLVDNCTWIRISLDAGTKEVYRITHGLDGTTFSDIVENTALLARMKKQRQSPVTIVTGFITFPEVVDDMEAYVKTSRTAGVDYAQFRPLLKKFQQEEFNHQADSRILEQIGLCQRLETNEFRVLCSLHKYRSMCNGSVRRNYARCHGHHFAAVIAANKKMYVCCHMRGIEKYCLGDLGRNSLEEIWRSPQRQRAYEQIHFADCPLLCRWDGFNTILWDISQSTEHESFL